MATTEPPTLQELREQLIRQLATLTGVEAPEITSGGIADLASAILDLDRVIHANAPAPAAAAMAPPALIKDALEHVWRELQDAGYPTAASDRAVAALRETPLFGGPA